MKEGIPQEYNFYTGGLKIDDKFYIKYIYRKNSSELSVLLYFHRKDDGTLEYPFLALSLINKRYVLSLFPVKLPYDPTFAEFRDDRGERMFLDTEFFSYNGTNNFSLRRYYKRDWSGYGNASGHMGGHNHTLGFNCVHSSDNLDKILSDLKIKGFMK